MRCSDVSTRQSRFIVLQICTSRVGTVLSYIILLIYCYELFCNFLTLVLLKFGKHVEMLSKLEGQVAVETVVVITCLQLLRYFPFYSKGTVNYSRKTTNEIRTSR